MPTTTKQLFIQMSGAPGSGKSSIARAVARQIEAVIIDHDVTKSALLDAAVDPQVAGRASYAVLAALADDLLQQGHTVIFDSPCFYTELLENGQRLAQKVGAVYGYIECVVSDLAVLDARLRARQKRTSQVTAVYQTITDGSGQQWSGENLFQEWIVHMKRPQTRTLTLDTTQPIDICLEQAITYLQTIQSS